MPDQEYLKTLVVLVDRSPLEFYGRNFNGGQHSSTNVIASDESISLIITSTWAESIEFILIKMVS